MFLMGTEFFWFYDILLIAIVLGVSFRCFKRGFFSVVLGFLATAVAFFIALYISEPISEYIYKDFIEEAVAEYAHNGVNDVIGENIITGLSRIDADKIKINGEYTSDIDLTPDSAGRITLDLSDTDLSETGINALDLSGFGIESDSVDYNSINAGKLNINAARLQESKIETLILAKTLSHIMQKSTNYGELLTIIDKVSEFLPQINSSIENDDLFSRIITSVVEADTFGAERAFLDGFVRPVIMVPVRAVVFFIIFAIISLILTYAAKTLRFINKIPVIGFINAILGGVVGIFESVVIMFLICIVLHIIISVTGNTIIFLNSMTIEETFIFKQFYFLDFLNFAN